MKDLYLTKISTITPEKIHSLMSPSNTHQEQLSKNEKLKHIAQYGDNDQTNLLLKSTFPLVRQSLAQFGSNEHRNKLLNDPNPTVRSAVALHGDNTHRKILLNDYNEGVRNIAKHYMK